MKNRTGKLPRSERELETLAAHYANQDMSELIDKAQPVTTPVEPMTTLTLRVPAALVDELRTAATQSHQRPSALARALLEAGLHPSSASDIESRVTRLEHLLTS